MAPVNFNSDSQDTGLSQLQCLDMKAEKISPPHLGRAEISAVVLDPQNIPTVLLRLEVRCAVCRGEYVGSPGHDIY